MDKLDERKKDQRITLGILTISIIAVAIYDPGSSYKPFAILAGFLIGSIPFFVASYSMKFPKFYEEIKRHHLSLIGMGTLIILLGMTVDNLMPWVDQTTLSNIGKCIADVHFRNHTETQFQECVAPDLEKIGNIQTITALKTMLYTLGSVFVGLGFRKKSINK